MEKEDKHYICTGTCGGSSPMPGVCSAETCPRFGKPLMECKCENGGHDGISGKCENCGRPVPAGNKRCADGMCAVEPFKPELQA